MRFNADIISVNSLKLVPVSIVYIGGNTYHNIVWVQTQMAVLRRDAAVVHHFSSTSLA